MSENAGPATLVHASAVAFHAPPGRRAVLIRGASGAGKSDLALRLIEAGGVLVADDQVALTRDGATLFAAAPASIRGLIEVRGLGIVRMPCVEGAAVALFVDLVGDPEMVERVPEIDYETIFDTLVRKLTIMGFEASAVMKIRIAMGLLPNVDIEGE